MVSTRSKTTPTRRQELLKVSARAVLDLISAGFTLDAVTVPLIAASVGFSSVYISTRVGLLDAKAEAIRLGIAERHPHLLAQLALSGDRRVKKFTTDELVKAFRAAIV
jgi:hypothetical protein